MIRSYSGEVMVQKRSQKHENAILLQFSHYLRNFVILINLEKIQPESIKLVWGDSELFRRSYGRSAEKVTYLLQSTAVLALFTTRDQDFNFFRSSKFRHTNFQIHRVFRTYLLVPKWCSTISGPSRGKCLILLF